MKFLLLILFFISVGFAKNFYYEYDKKVYLEKKIQDKKTRSKNHSFNTYLTKEGKTISFKHEIIVQCKENKSCENDFRKLKLNNFEKIAGTFYLIKLQREQNIFDYSQKLYKLDNIKTAKPNLKVSKVKR